MLKRPLKKPPDLLPCKWKVIEGNHFVRVVGLFDSEVDADKCIAEKREGMRHKVVTDWKQANVDWA